MKALGFGELHLVFLVVAGFAVSATAENSAPSNVPAIHVPASRPPSFVPVDSSKGTAPSPPISNPTKTAFFEKDMPIWVNNLIALFAATVSFANLAVVIWFFVCTNRDHERERVDDKKERSDRIQREVGNFWIQELILKSSNDFVHAFFDKYEQKIKDFQTKCGGSDDKVNSLSNDAARLVAEFKSEFHQLDKRLVEPLEWVSGEFQKLRPVMRDFEDLVTEELATIRLPVSKTQVGTEETSEMKYRRLRSEFFKQLHTAHKKFVGI